MRNTREREREREREKTSSKDRERVLDIVLFEVAGHHFEWADVEWMNGWMDEYMGSSTWSMK